MAAAPSATAHKIKKGGRIHDQIKNGQTKLAIFDTELVQDEF